MNRPLFLPVRGRCLPQSRVGQGLLAELGQFLRGWCGDLRRRRDYANLVDGEAALAIVADIGRRDATAASVAFTAQQADLEAVALLVKAKEDGLDSSDLPLLEQALRNINRSAEADREIAEGLAS
jgi:hypothetical protein